MVSAQRAIRAYDSAVAEFSECLHEAGLSPTRANRAVDTVTAIASRFNAELRAFKKRNGA
jgi:hypothetical protein